VPTSRDDETEAVEQAELVARFYKTLLAKGIGFAAAQTLTSAWILSRRKLVGVDPLEGLGNDRG
jgi:hypothetical protein